MYIYIYTHIVYIYIYIYTYICTDVAGSLVTIATALPRELWEKRPRLGHDPVHPGPRRSKKQPQRHAAMGLLGLVQKTRRIYIM